MSRANAQRYRRDFCRLPRRVVRMRRIADTMRVERLMRDAIARLDMDLSGISVLTEAASGNYAVTPLIAAMAGASRVVALTRDSSHGTTAEVTDYVGGLANHLGVSSRIQITDDRVAAADAHCDLVTNLGFVRPIDRAIVTSLSKDAVICLMWEPWEFRSADIDIEVCREHDVPIIGTHETDERIATFHYLGPLALKLLLEADIEVYRSRLLVIGEAPFLEPIVTALTMMGAMVEACSVSKGWSGTSGQSERAVAACDGVVVADHRSGQTVIGGQDGIPPRLLGAAGVAVVHICGVVDDEAMTAEGIHKVPARRVKPGYMAMATDYVGPRPVVDLHAAGLKVGEIAVRARRAGLTSAQAVDRAVASGLAQPLVI
jgi:hypothetical protein